MKTTFDPTFEHLLLAFRQAKNATAAEKDSVGRLELARFEARLPSRLTRLQRKLTRDQWFDDLSIGRLFVAPRSVQASAPHGNDDIVRIGVRSDRALHMKVRFQLAPTPEFSIAEVIYLWEFGGALETLLDDSCLGYRLKRISSDGGMDRYERTVYEYWSAAFERYRNEPIVAARDALMNADSVMVTSTDVVSFFDSIDPQFLLETSFVDMLVASAAQAHQPFSRERFVRATASLLTRYAEFRRSRVDAGSYEGDDGVGIPIGALTSRVFANVALSSVDTYVQRLSHVLMYRRYVDDIVIVSRPSTPSGPRDATETLAELFPHFSSVNGRHRFSVPATRAIFDLKQEKTRVHFLKGIVGAHFLGAVQRSFSAVTSERRAFVGDVDRLTSEFATIKLARGNDEGVDAASVGLRDADRFTLRRYMAGAYVRSLERCAVLLAKDTAAALLERRIQRMLTILEGNPQLEDFDFVCELLEVALLCNSGEVAHRLRDWLAARAGTELRARVDRLEWRGRPLDRAAALKAVRGYLLERVRQSLASASAFGVAHGIDKRLAREAVLLRDADLRRLDREDDANVFGTPATSQRKRRGGRRMASLIRRFLSSDTDAVERLNSVRAFLDISAELNENVWADLSDVALFLGTKPPSYADIARRMLARLELQAESFDDVGARIDHIADALRGTRYARRRVRPLTVINNPNHRLITVGEPLQPSAVRVILSNLPVSLQAFLGAVNDEPVLTYARLQALNRALRAARRAKNEAAQRGLPSILLLPELSIPRRWVRALINHSVREEMAIAAGIEYLTTPSGVSNQAIGVFPTGRNGGVIVGWTKRNPARREASLLECHRKRFWAGITPRRRLIVESAHGRLSVLICSEILETEPLAALSGHLELLLVPAWNDDTPSFEHIVHSVSSLLLHSFVCVANNAEASDSRVAAPVRSPRYEREWCRLIHRGASQIIWADVPTGALRQFHEGPTAGTQVGTTREFRPLPPGWPT